MKRRIAASLAAATALAIPAAALASGDDAEVRQAGKCDGSSTSKIKVKQDDGGLEVEFEVDQNKTGDKWKVKINDNGKSVYKGSAVTKGRSGSFSIEKRIADLSGTDSVSAVGKNTATGERCSASASF